MRPMTPSGDWNYGAMTSYEAQRFLEDALDLMLVQTGPEDYTVDPAMKPAYDLIKLARNQVRRVNELSRGEHSGYVTITHGMRGYFAVLMVWDSECGDYTPWNSGFGSFETREEAEPEAIAWALDEDVAYIDSSRRGR